MNYKEENYEKYPTVADLSKADRSWSFNKEGMKYPELAGVCGVCGKRIGQRVRCNHCGFDRSIDYEEQYSLVRIPKGIDTVLKKREVYQEEQFLSRVKAILQPLEQALKQTEDKNGQLQSAYEEMKKKNSSLSNDLEEINKKNISLVNESIKPLEQLVKQTEEKCRQLQSFCEELEKKNISLSNDLEQLKKQNNSQSIGVNQKKIENTVTTSGKRQINNLRVGEEIQFGSYPQTKDGATQPIIWKVLDVKDGKALLQSVMGLDAKPYNQKRKTITWESCDLRKWLNNEFYTQAFTKSEKGQIDESNVIAEKNPKYDTNPGRDVKDHVFLLSIGEARRYYGNDEERECRPSEYAVANGAYRNDNTKCCCWWLRSPGCTSDGAAGVSSGGWVELSGFTVDLGSLAVRPALWINL